MSVLVRPCDRREPATVCDRRDCFATAIRIVAIDPGTDREQVASACLDHCEQLVSRALDGRNGAVRFLTPEQPTPRDPRSHLSSRQDRF